MKDSKELFSAPEVAKILNISRNAVFKRIKSGDLKAVKVGRNYIISRDEVQKALGLALGEKSKENIDRIVKKAVRQYGEAFRKLGRG